MSGNCVIADLVKVIITDSSHGPCRDKLKVLGLGTGSQASVAGGHCHLAAQDEMDHSSLVPQNSRANSHNTGLWASVMIWEGCPATRLILIK